MAVSNPYYIMLKSSHKEDYWFPFIADNSGEYSGEQIEYFETVEAAQAVADADTYAQANGYKVCHIEGQDVTTVGATT